MEKFISIQSDTQGKEFLIPINNIITLFYKNVRVDIIYKGESGKITKIYLLSIPLPNITPSAEVLETLKRIIPIAAASSNRITYAPVHVTSVTVNII